ncbi:MAG: hypothetical protein QW705_05260 [Zestosphaera sp.]
MSARRFVALPERVLSDAVRVAEEVGVPYTVLIERILTEVLKVMRYRRDVLELLAVADSLNDVRRLGGLVLPEGVVKEVLSRLSRDDLSRMCAELGRMSAWFGELGRVKRALTPNEFRNSLSLWLPSASIDVLKEDTTFKFVVSVANPSSELLMLSRCVIEGLVRGYDIKEHEISLSSSVITVRLGGLVEE